VTTLVIRADERVSHGRVGGHQPVSRQLSAGGFSMWDP